MDSYGFILTRHVNSEITNKYWNICVQLLIKFYPNRKIIIIDDNSIQTFIKPDFEYKNITIINSEFKGRGELLPYYYFLKNKFFYNAVIIHDSVFFHSKIEFDILQNCNVMPLWFFDYDKENINNTLRISNVLLNKHEIHNKLSLNNNVLGMKHLKWYGCFGCMCYINHNFLIHIEKKYSITRMLHVVKNRSDRCCLERILGAIFCKEDSNLLKVRGLLGNIMKYYKWKYSYEDYQNDIKKGIIPRCVIKVWSGR
jgi:hypothetical protein